MNQNNKINIEILEPEMITDRMKLNEAYQRIRQLALQVSVLNKYLGYVQDNFNLSEAERKTLAQFHENFQEFL